MINSHRSTRFPRLSDLFATRLPILLLLGIVALGTYARLIHSGDVPLCMDEAWRIANLLDADSLLTQMFLGMNRVDPPLFSLAIFFLAGIYNVEFVLRLVSMIPGILAVPLAYLVGRQLFKSRWLAVMAGFLTAFSLELMVYSKELKPYSLCAFVHLALLYAYLKYRGNINPRTTVIFTALLALSIPLSLHSVFAFPGLFLALLAGTFLTGARKQGKLVLISCIALVLFSALCFFLLIGGTENADQLDYMRGYWGNQLCPADSCRGAIAWLAPRYLEHYTDIAFHNRLAPGFIGRNLHLIYPVLTLLGFIALLLRDRRRFFEAFCLFAMPLVVMALFSLAQQWPFGQLRMNIFVIIYVLFPPLFLFDELGRASAKLRPLVPLAVCALMVIQFPLEFREFSHRRPLGSWQASADGLEHILDVYTAGPRIPLVSNHLGQSQFSYYSKHHRHLSARYAGQAHLFDPRGMRTRSSAFYLRGTMLRVCQESRQAAIYLTHYLPPEAMIYKNDYCVEHNAWEGISSYACLITSEIYDAARTRKGIFSRERFSARGQGWKQVYLSPPLDIEGAIPGTLIVFNFDLVFHTPNKRIKLVFLDENDSGESFEKPVIEYDRPIHGDHLESAASVKLSAAVRTMKLAIVAKDTHDFTVTGLEYFVVRDQTPEAPDEPFRIAEDMCERIRLLRSIRSVDRFWDNHLDGFGWTKGNGVIELDEMEIDARERLFMLETYGWLLPEVREDIIEGSLRVYFNRTVRAPLIRIEGDQAVKCYFRIPEDVQTVRTISIHSRTFIPNDHGINDDGRSLGIDVKAIGFPRIVREVKEPGGYQE